MPTQVATSASSEANLKAPKKPRTSASTKSKTSNEKSKPVKAQSKSKPAKTSKSTAARPAAKDTAKATPKAKRGSESIESPKPKRRKTQASQSDSGESQGNAIEPSSDVSLPSSSQAPIPDLPSSRPPSSANEAAKTPKNTKFTKEKAKTAKESPAESPAKESAAKESPTKVTKTKSKAKASKAKSSKDSDESVKEEEALPTPEPSSQIKEEDAEEIYKWWEENKEDDSIKWDSLDHNGVIFPPAYEPLPLHVYLVYDGKPVSLPIEAEEVAGFFGAMINTDHAEKKIFQNNFFEDFKTVLKKAGGAKVKDTGAKINISYFNKCDFSKIFEYYEQQRAVKKALPAAEKKRIKLEKDEIEDKYKFCMLNGRKQPVGNFRIEPPGLFRGRGMHPKTGKLKERVQPEQVTINISEGVKVPEPPAGHQWAEVRHDPQVSWLATWKENINGNIKYVFLAHNSSLKGMSDFKKFEKARELHKHVARIRSDYRRELTDEVMQVRQRATAMYLIDAFALRAGGEKGDDEADTVGCCSLRYEHVTLEAPNLVTFDFLGKDSIRYFQKVEVDPQVFNNLSIFKRAPKGPGDDIFDRLDPSLLNNYLRSYMDGLSAKVFRTYNASYTMQKQLDGIPNEGTVPEKVVAFNAANRAVAILCNHQKTIAKTHGESVAKIEDKVQDLVWQTVRLKKMLLQVDPNRPKVLGKPYFADIKSLNKKQTAAIHKRLVEQERDKIEKKFTRDNGKIAAQIAAGEEAKELGDEDLAERLKAVDELRDKLDKELETGHYEIKDSLTPEKLEAQIAKVEDRVLAARMNLKDKQDNSTVQLSTSKTNYIDPRLSVMFAKRFNVPIEKLFNNSLRKKFEWAIHSAGADWQFVDDVIDATKDESD